jgi:hypothetical protein
MEVAMLVVRIRVVHPATGFIPREARDQGREWLELRAGKIPRFARDEEGHGMKQVRG